MRGRTVLAIAITVYVVSALVDYVLTYVYVAILGLYREANPFCPYRHPWLWVAGDVCALTFTVLAVKKVAELGLRSCARRGCSELSASMLRNWPFLVLGVAIVRSLPVVHNALLILTGYESPLVEIHNAFLRALGWAG